MRWERMPAFLALGAIGVMLLAACTGPTDKRGATSPPTAAGGSATVRSWMEVPLKDVATGKEFRIGDFRGKPVLLESFAVWCPTCLQQQKNIQKLKSTEGDAIVHISLDTDPNEDEAKVREHVKANGFDWYFAISPVALTRDLISEFGLTIVSAPSSPVALVCEDQSARLLRSGVKSPDDLLSEIKKGCK